MDIFNSKGSASFEVVIGEHTKFDGDVVAKGNVKIDGKLNGNIKSDGEVYTGENSSVSGDITSRNLVISGKVTGAIKATDDLRINTSGYLEGDILVSSFIIEEGGTFKGNCSINTKQSKKDLEELNNEFKVDSTQNESNDKSDSKNNKKKKNNNKKNNK